MTAQVPSGWPAGIELREDWLAQVQEDIIDPAREIVDPHHHLWVRGTPEAPAVYEMDALHRDTKSGHNVVQTVYIECRSYWDTAAPEHLQPVAETAAVVRMARAAAPGGASIAGIVAYIDLTLAPDLLDAAIDAHLDAGAGLVKGIRHSGARDAEPERLIIPGRGTQGQYADPAFRRGVARLGERGLTFDTWHFHHQNDAFRALAQAVPDTTMVLDHFGTPLGVGRFAGRHDAIFADWQRDIDAIAGLPNVVAKLGGLAMPDNGFGWKDRDLPPGSDEIVEVQGRWYSHTLAAFGPERCMFESNFPVDRTAVSYAVLWNAFKKMSADLDASHKDMVFAGTARRVYGLPPA